MNLGQIHECLRRELLRRVKRGTLSVSLLARQTGFGSSHISSVLRGTRKLSLEGMDRLMAAQDLTLADLLEAARTSARGEAGAQVHEVPLVSHFIAMHEPVIRAHAIEERFQLPATLLPSDHTGGRHPRRNWHRFVAVRISANESAPMEPMMFAENILILDRHFVTFVPHRPVRKTIYAVWDKTRLKLRYADYQLQRIILRAHQHSFPVELIEVSGDRPMAEVLAGRVALVLNSL